MGIVKSVLDIASPLGYAIADGNEKRMRFSAGFCPQMLTNTLGEVISKKWHFDPIYRYQKNLSIKKKLNVLCPNIESFKLNFQDGIETNCNSISGVYGISFVSTLFGLGAVYRDTEWVEVEKSSFSIEQIANIKEIHVENTEIYEDIMKQMDVMQGEFGEIKGHLNLQGVLNIAFKLRNEDIFMDMYDEEELCKNLFDCICKTILKSQKLIQSRQRKSGYDVDMLVPADCVINMVSPSMYEQFLFQYDKLLVESFAYSGLHTCNWNVTPYLDVLKGIDNLGYLDMGINSEVLKVQECFPTTRKSVLLSPMFLKEDWKKQKSQIDKVARAMNPVDFTMGSIDSGASIEALNRLNDYIVNHITNV